MEATDQCPPVVHGGYETFGTVRKAVAFFRQFRKLRHQVFVHQTAELFGKIRVFYGFEINMDQIAFLRREGHLHFARIGKMLFDVGGFIHVGRV